MVKFCGQYPIDSVVIITIINLKVFMVIYPDPNCIDHNHSKREILNVVTNSTSPVTTISNNSKKQK